MKIYSILTQNNLRSSEQPAIFIEESFSLMALILQVLWLLYHRIWVPAIILIVFHSMLLIMFQYKIISGNLLHCLELVVALIIAVFAKTWYIENLKKNDYQLKYVIAAKNLDEAKLRFYQGLGEYKDV